MAVIINQLDHIPATAASRPRGGDGGGEGGRPAAAPQAGTIPELRREASRLARLWAD